MNSPQWATRCAIIATEPAVRGFRSINLGDGMMKSGNGFARLRGLAVAGAVSVAGMFSAAAARAATTGLPLTVTRSSAVWSGIDNNNSFPSSSTVTTTNGAVYPTATVGFGIGDAGLEGSGGSSGVNGIDGKGSGFFDAFDNALILAVDGTLFQNPDTTVDLTGDTVTSDTATIVPGVDAQVRYNFFPGRPVARALFSLTNTTGAPISVDAAVLGDYGSDNGTAVQATSSGDTVIDGADLWYITDDQGGQPSGQNKPGRGGDRGFGDPRITLSRYGADADVVPFNALTPGPNSPVFGLRYPITIAAGATARILVFIELSDPTVSVEAAATAAADFESLDALTSAGLLSGLSSTEIGEIVNYGQPDGGGVPAGPAVELPVMGPGGLFALFGVLGGFGYFELRRRRKLEAA
jgi:hypothetical protein